MPAAASSKRPILVLAILLAAAFFAFLLHIFVGTVDVSLWDVVRALFGAQENTVIVWDFRMPRAMLAVLSGALLGIVGSSFQALFRNALADPYIVGVSSGAAVGGATALVTGFGAAWGGWAAGLGPMLASTVGGMLALGMVVSLSVRRGVLEPHTLLLTGVVLGSLLSSLLSLILLWGQANNQILNWMLGHLTPAYWNRTHLMAIALGIGAPILILQSKRINALTLGEETAMRLGVDTKKLKPLVLGVGAAMVAVTVGAVGIIGFLGLVAPHIARRLVGVDWRWSLIASGLVGSGLMCIADILAQRIVPATEVPVGIVTAVLGAPFLIILLRKGT